MAPRFSDINRYHEVGAHLSDDVRRHVIKNAPVHKDVAPNLLRFKHTRDRATGPDRCGNPDPRQELALPVAIPYALGDGSAGEDDFPASRKVRGHGGIGDAKLIHRGVLRPGARIARKAQRRTPQNPSAPSYRSTVDKSRATRSIASAVQPVAQRAPIRLPILVPEITSTGMRSCSKTFNTPMCARPLQPPPPRANPVDIVLPPWA